MRVFSDRLINEEDKNMFISECLNFEGSRFFKPEELEDPAGIIFANFVEGEKVHPLPYQEIKNMQ